MTPKLQVSCLAIRDGQLALIKRVDPTKITYNCYIPPGGHVEMHETVEQACIREIQEETGLLLNQVEIRGMISFLTHTQEDHAVSFILVARDVQGELVALEPDKLLPYWIPITDVSEHQAIPGYYKDIIAAVLSTEQFINARVEWLKPDGRLTWSILDAKGEHVCPQRIAQQ